MTNAHPPRIVLGVSSCLLGQRVRYDGAARSDAYIVDTLAPYVEFVPFCPEVESGMGVPRPPVQLVGDPRRPRMLGVADPRADFTTRMLHCGATAGGRIGAISGYIFKSRSPSCAVWDAPVFTPEGSVRGYGAGLFARAIVKHGPYLPLQDERALHALEVRDRFFEQVFSYRRWQCQVVPELTLAALREFHVAHKYSVLAHDQNGYRVLGRMLATATLSPAFTANYAAQFFAALRKATTRASHVNVLQHLVGYFKKSAPLAERQRVLELISSYHGGLIELGAVLHAVRVLNARYPNDYLRRQIYLYPEPDEATLRASVTREHWDGPVR
jgi:uncharacterized protein YbgA (DUF1722 family)/uncharacterized protein YbbK (DUF523 family)